MKKNLFKLFAILMVLAMVAAPASANVAQKGNGPVEFTTAASSDIVKYSEGDFEAVKGVDGPVRFIIQLEDAPLVSYEGALDGYKATNPAVLGNGKLDAKSPDSKAYMAYLADKQTSALKSMQQVLGRELKVAFRYSVSLNGFAVEMDAAELEKVLQNVPGIVKVEREKIQHLDTDAGPGFIGATDVWNLGATGSKGEGILVGIIDSGINFDHPSFAEVGPVDAYVHENPLDDSNPATVDYLGVCDPTNAEQYIDTYVCNDKLIGAYSYVDTDAYELYTPEDSGGHGSHTASTVAGNVVVAEMVKPTITETQQISGVAPHANIIAYDVCVEDSTDGGCPGAAIISAIDQAILDGVDVINFSISGGEDPYNDLAEQSFLAATDAGVFVSTSAGNAGPDPETTGHRSPWLMSSAASTHNRAYPNGLIGMSGGDTIPPVDMVGKGFTSALAEKEIVYAGDFGNALCLLTSEGGVWNAGTDFTNKIVVCDRGTSARVDKAIAVQAKGAVGYVLANNAASADALTGDAYVIPGVHITYADGVVLKTWLASGTGHKGAILGATRDTSASNGNVMADFSSRGPNGTIDILKPDVTAPGVDIWAAVNSAVPGVGDPEFDFYSGTSMSSPHTAGAAALLKALHPTWTPAEIKSALMLTAVNPGILKEDGTTAGDVFDFGAGLIQVDLAADAGLVMNETKANFDAANPAEGGDVTTLNIASLYSSRCVGECSWTRTFTSVSALPATYTVSAPAWITVVPTNFTIDPGATQDVAFTADVSAFTSDEWQYADIEFNTDSVHAGPITVLLGEDFDDATFPPTDWLSFNPDGSATQWVRSSAASSAYHSFGTAAVTEEGWLITPPVIADSTTLVKFWEKSPYPTYYADHSIYVCDTTADCTTDTTNYTLLEEVGQLPNTSWRQTLVSLSTYAGKTVRLAFVYAGNDADGWYVDDVSVENIPDGVPIPDMHIPAAVLPTSSNLPDLVEYTTHRDAGSNNINELIAVEITDLTIDTYGFVKGQPIEISLPEDSTNGNAYDDLNQVYYTLIPMDDGAARVVAEITATTALDVDLFWGFDINGDGLPAADELYGSSATATAYEYLSDVNFPVAFYDVWVLVQNWEGSTAATDEITLSLGVVPYTPSDPATMTVSGPETNPAGTEFSLLVAWHDIDTEAGDRLYGLFDAYADAAQTMSMGMTEVDVVRGADDVVKTADVNTAEPGDTITYSIEITNFSMDPVEYSINDVLPEGVTYVADSVTGGASYDAVTNAITWTGPVDGSYRDYVAATSAEDPNCTLQIFGADADPTDAYMDWKTTSSGFSTNASVFGDSFLYTGFSTYPQFNYYGVNYTGLKFTADGYVGFDIVTNSNVNQEVPNATNPNNLLAMFWDDFTVVYDAATNKGVTLVGSSASGIATVEYDDLQLNADPTKTLDMEVGVFGTPDDTPGMYEVVFAYDNITPGLFAAASGTIGVENAAGTAGTLYSYNDTALTIADGSAICFDWALLPAPPKVITFEVTVDADASENLLINTVLHDNDLLSSVEEAAVAVVELSNLNNIPVAVAESYNVDESRHLAVAAPGVLSNDTDTDGDVLTAVLVTTTTHGTLIFNTDGSFAYTPDTNFSGVDSFTYKAYDEITYSNIVTVTINVPSIPVNGGTTIFLPLIMR